MVSRSISTLLFSLLCLVAVQAGFATETEKGTETETDRQPGAISGSVEDRRTGEPLIGVHVMIGDAESGTGTTTGNDGSFRIEDIQPGVYELTFSYIGYESFIRNDVVVRPGRTSTLSIRLSETGISGDEVVVRAGYFERRNEQPVSTASFNPEEIRRAPGGGQEVLRIVNMLPSVATVGDTRQDILVRGGSTLENAYYVDNIPMPGIQHFRQQSGRTSGPIGIINTDLVADLEFNSGGFGASYGDAMSSVTNITYREGNRNGFQGDVNLNMAGFGGTLEQGFAGEQGSVMISARRSYLDLIADAINAGGAPRYTDAQMKAVYDLNSSNRLSLINIYGGSNFSSDAQDALDEGFDTYFDTENRQNTLGANLRTVWSGGFFTNTSLSWSVSSETSSGFDLFDRGSGIEEEESFSMEAVDHQLALRSVSYNQLAGRAGLEFGTDLRYETGTYDYFIAAGTDRAGNPRPDFHRDLSLSGSRAALFATLRLTPTGRLSLNPGLRAEYTEYNGQVDWSPRVSARYELTSRLSANAAWGLFHQNNSRFLLSQSDTNRKLDNPRAMHFVGGLEYLLSPETLLSLEVYQKNYSRMPELPDGSNGDPSWVFDNAGAYYPDLVSTGEGRARGAELLLQKKMADGFYGTVSASFFRTRYRDFEDNWRDRDYDIRYLFSVNGGYRPNDRWEFSARWSWQGGSPRTPFDRDASIQAESGVFDLNRFNRERTASFHALYVRFDRRFFFKQTNLVTFVEVWNAYNRANVDSYEWSAVHQEVRTINQFSVLPVGGISFEF